MPTTHKEFGCGAGALEAAAAVKDEIRGMIVLITGISPNSIGSQLALSISSQHPRILILASRTPSNILSVRTTILSAYPDAIIHAIPLDLSKTSSVTSAVTKIQHILSQEGGGEGEGEGGKEKIDVLFNNAGINIPEKLLSEEGVEMQFVTNHLGPFLFTKLLIQKGLIGKGRVVNTASEAHLISPVRFSDINQEKGNNIPSDEKPRRGLPDGMLKKDGSYDRTLAYAQSKTANILFSVGLNTRYSSLGLQSFAVSPGNIMTGIVRSMNEADMKSLFQGVDDKWKTLDQGASTLVVAGFDPALDAKEGVYLEDCQMKRPARWASDVQKAERLWKLSEELVARGSCEGGRGSRL